MTIREQIIAMQLSCNLERALLLVLDDCKCADEFDFTNLTELQKKQISNALEGLDAPFILHSAFNTGQTFNVKINGTEDLDVPNVNNQKTYYPIVNPPFAMVLDGVVNLNYRVGEYLYVYANMLDNSKPQYQKVFKNINNDALYTADGNVVIRLQKTTVGQADLVTGQAYNFELDNQTTHQANIHLWAQYNQNGEFMQGVSGSVVPFTQWDYSYAYLWLDLTGSTTGVVAELWKADDSQLIQTTNLQAGTNHVNRWTGQMQFSNYNTRDYKLILKDA